MTDTRDRVVNVIAAVLNVPPAELSDRSSPDDIESWDSMKQLQLFLAVEEEFGVQLPADAADTLQTVGAIVNAVTERVS